MNDAGEHPCELRLLIVDDHGLVRQGLLALFQAVEHVEVLAAGATEADWATRRFRPDVVVVRATLCDGHAFRAARTILAQRPAPRVLFLDDAVHPAHVCAALATGASGYWTMRASFDQFAEAVRRVAAGGESFCPAAEAYAQRYLVSTVCGPQFRPLAGP